MSAINHKHMLSIMPKRPGDYKPWGNVERWEDPHTAYPDCSCGCKWFALLEGELCTDWGVCCNPESHRVGLLTFEHQGCMKFDADTDEDDEPAQEGGELTIGPGIDEVGNVSVKYTERLK